MDWQVKRINIGSASVTMLADMLFLYLPFLKGKHRFRFIDEAVQYRKGDETQLRTRK